MDIRARIRQLLEERQIKVQRASLDAGLGQTTLRDFLDNPERAITDRTLTKLADYFGVTLEVLLLDNPFQHSEAARLWNELTSEEQRGVIAYMQTVKDSRTPKKWASVYDRPRSAVAESPQSRFAGSTTSKKETR